MQVVPSGGQTNASGAMLSPNLVQVTESTSGSVVPLAMFYSSIWTWYFLDAVAHCRFVCGTFRFSHQRFKRLVTFVYFWKYIFPNLPEFFQSFFSNRDIALHIRTQNPEMLLVFCTFWCNFPTFYEILISTWNIDPDVTFSTLAVTCFFIYNEHVWCWHNTV